jgi:hypothetical protein
MNRGRRRRTTVRHRYFGRGLTVAECQIDDARRPRGSSALVTRRSPSATSRRTVRKSGGCARASPTNCRGTGPAMHGTSSFARHEKRPHCSGAWTWSLVGLAAAGLRTGSVRLRTNCCWAVPGRTRRTETLPLSCSAARPAKRWSFSAPERMDRLAEQGIAFGPNLRTSARPSSAAATESEVRSSKPFRLASTGFRPRSIPLAWSQPATVRRPAEDDVPPIGSSVGP